MTTPDERTPTIRHIEPDCTIPGHYFDSGYCIKCGKREPDGVLMRDNLVEQLKAAEQAYMDADDDDRASVMHDAHATILSLRQRLTEAEATLDVARRTHDENVELRRERDQLTSIYESNLERLGDAIEEAVRERDLAQDETAYARKAFDRMKRERDDLLTKLHAEQDRRRTVQREREQQERYIDKMYRLHEKAERERDEALAHEERCAAERDHAERERDEALEEAAGHRNEIRALLDEMSSVRSHRATVGMQATVLRRERDAMRRVVKAAEALRDAVSVGENYDKHDMALYAAVDEYQKEQQVQAMHPNEATTRETSGSPNGVQTLHTSTSGVEDSYPEPPTCPVHHGGRPSGCICDLPSKCERCRGMGYTLYECGEYCGLGCGGPHEQGCPDCGGTGKTKEQG